MQTERSFSAASFKFGCTMSTWAERKKTLKQFWRNFKPCSNLTDLTQTGVTLQPLQTFSRSGDQLTAFAVCSCSELALSILKPPPPILLPFMKRLFFMKEYPAHSEEFLFVCGSFVYLTTNERDASTDLKYLTHVLGLVTRVNTVVMGSYCIRQHGLCFANVFFFFLFWQRAKEALQTFSFRFDDLNWACTNLK